MPSGSLCNNVENLRVDTETYPWGKKRSKIKLIGKLNIGIKTEPVPAGADATYMYVYAI